jgi:hypothetical protein
MRVECAPRIERAGNVLEQRVPPAHERRDDELDLLALPVYHGLDVVEEPVGDLRGGAQLVNGHSRPPVWKRGR